MKRIISVTFLILLLYLVYKVLINMFFNEYDYSYFLKKEDVIIRVNQKTELTDEEKEIYSCYIELIYKDMVFNTKLALDEKEEKKQVTDFIFKKQDSNVCIYPIIEDRNAVDVLCNINGKEKEYSSIKGENKEIDLFIEQLKKEGYSYYAWYK